MNGFGEDLADNRAGLDNGVNPDDGIQGTLWSIVAVNIILKGVVEQGFGDNNQFRQRRLMGQGAAMRKLRGGANLLGNADSEQEQFGHCMIKNLSE